MSLRRCRRRPRRCSTAHRWSRASAGPAARSCGTTARRRLGWALLERTGGRGLDEHLELTVLRGSGGCGRFRPDGVDHVGLGAGVLYRGTLRGFPDDVPSFQADPGGLWEPGASLVYRFVVRLTPDAPQGLTASQRFIWHASSA